MMNNMKKQYQLFNKNINKSINKNKINKIFNKINQIKIIYK